MHDVDVVSGRAQRLHAIRPFHVMGLLRRAHELEAAGRHIVHMEIGEPDFATAEPVVAAGVRALRAGRTHYLPAAGLPELREAIAAHYAQRYGVEVPSERIFITPGASGALTLAAALTMNPGSDMLLPEPGYPCNRNFVALVNGRPVALPVQAQADYQPTVAAVEAAITPSTAALLLASPSNPTGTMLDAERLAQLGTCAHNREMALIVDEIYHGLHYDAEPASAVQHAPNALVVNSFSKYFGMTGWRLGWLVVPQGWEADTEKLIQNLFINASTPAQYAALACFTEPAQAIFEARREAFRERRDFLLPALRQLGFDIPGTPAGAFYLYADCTALAQDSWELARGLLEHAGVAATPGRDFEDGAPERHIRFAYTTSLAELETAVERIPTYLAAGG